MSTGIEWTDATWNPVSGCTRVSAGCDHCYAVKQTHRLEAMGQAKYTGLTVLNPRGERHFNGQVRCHEEALSIPLKWRAGRRIFVNSMSDLFHKEVPIEFIDRVFAVMALCPQHTFQVLTKRPERMAEYLTRRETIYAGFSRKGGALVMEKTPCDKVYAIARKTPGCRPELLWPLPNVWLGTSVEDQAAADERIPHLMRCPAAVRFLSCEPLLGAIDLAWPLQFDEHHPQEGDLPRGGFLHGRKCESFCDYACGGAEYNGARPIDWVIVGGESGKEARPCDVGWVRSIVGQCKVAGVPVFVKQLGAVPVFPPYATNGEPTVGKWYEGTVGDDFDTHLVRNPKGGDISEWPEDLRVREMPGVVA